MTIASTNSQRWEYGPDVVSGSLPALGVSSLDSGAVHAAPPFPFCSGA